MATVQGAPAFDHDLLTEEVRPDFESVPTALFVIAQIDEGFDHGAMLLLIGVKAKFETE